MAHAITQPIAFETQIDPNGSFWDASKDAALSSCLSILPIKRTTVVVGLVGPLAEVRVETMFDLNGLQRRSSVMHAVSHNFQTLTRLSDQGG